MKRISLILLLLLLQIQVFFAFDSKSILNSGNELYKKGLYSQSASKYQQLVDSGYMSFGLYYNLGNAYFKAKDNKSAILYYEKANLIKPGDEELEYNLSFARSKVVDKIEAIPDLFFVEWTKSFRNQFSADSWALYSIISFILALIGFTAYFFSGQLIIKKSSFWIAGTLLIVSILSVTFASGAYSSQIKQRTAIIFVKAVTVKSSPADSGTNLFVLHEGTKVKIIDKVENWHKIKIPDGNQGWVKESDLAKI